MGRILLRVRRWICRLLGRAVPYRVAVSDGAPDTPESETLYLYEAGGDAWGAGLVCPCGCGELIELNLLPAGRPCWSVEVEWDGRVSVRPSVWRNVGCRSHFWVERGLVRWVR